METKDITCEESYIHKDKVNDAKLTLVPVMDGEELARTFQALADPTRVRIISALLRTELCVCDISALLKVSQSAVSHQLRQLRDMRLVKSRKVGRIVYYTLDDEHISELFTLGREHLRHK
ncbi:MAG: winged helix-turn-helix transcriptional regulator [Acidobacteria bacterium]|nr:winged helix-turn-helix transcriptional regulator [Acidobacteriota bacterium]